MSPSSRWQRWCRRSPGVSPSAAPCWRWSSRSSSSARVARRRGWCARPPIAARRCSPPRARSRTPVSACSDSPPRGCPARRATSRPSSHAVAGAAATSGPRGRGRGGRAVNNAVVLTHTQPEQTSTAVGEAVTAGSAAGWRLYASDDELAKHADAAAGLEPLTALEGRPDLCLVLGGDGTILKALRAYAGSEVPVFAINFGTVGFLAAVEREELDGRPAVRVLRRLRGDGAARPRGDRRRRSAARPQRRLADPPPAQPGGRARLPPRRQGGRPRSLRRPGRGDARRLDRLQPRELRSDPRLGRRGLRGQLHRPAHAHRPTAGGGARRRALGHQRGRARSGRGRARRRAGRRACERGRDGGPVPRRRRSPGPAAGRELLPAHPRQVRTPGSWQLS